MSSNAQTHHHGSNTSSPLLSLRYAHQGSRKKKNTRDVIVAGSDLSATCCPCSASRLSSREQRSGAGEEDQMVDALLQPTAVSRDTILHPSAHFSHGPSGTSCRTTTAQHPVPPPTQHPKHRRPARTASCTLTGSPQHLPSDHTTHSANHTIVRT